MPSLCGSLPFIDHGAQLRRYDATKVKEREGFKSNTRYVKGVVWFRCVGNNIYAKKRFNKSEATNWCDISQELIYSSPTRSKHMPEVNIEVLVVLRGNCQYVRLRFKRVWRLYCDGWTLISGINVDCCTICGNLLPSSQ